MGNTILKDPLLKMGILERSKSKNSTYYKILGVPGEIPLLKVKTANNELSFTNTYIIMLSIATSFSYYVCRLLMYICLF